MESIIPHTPMLLMLFPLSSSLVAPQANVARHKAGNHVLNHIVRNVIEPPPELKDDRGKKENEGEENYDSQRIRKRRRRAVSRLDVVREDVCVSCVMLRFKSDVNAHSNGYTLRLESLAGLFLQHSWGGHRPGAVLPAACGLDERATPAGK